MSLSIENQTPYAAMFHADRGESHVTIDVPSQGIARITDEHEGVSVNTVQAWTVYAIVNGITTPVVNVPPPNTRAVVKWDSAPFIVVGD